jgi:hypothetical protein
LAVTQLQQLMATGTLLRGDVALRRTGVEVPLQRLDDQPVILSLG